jgi:hypothetical protein
LVDWIALLVSHSLIALMFWRLVWRNDLDDEAAPDRRHRPPGFGQPGTASDQPAYDGPERRSNGDGSPPRSGWRGDA